MYVNLPIWDIPPPLHTYILSTLAYVQTRGAPAAAGLSAR